MPINEQRERSFIKWVEAVGLQEAVMEYVRHCTEDEFQEISLQVNQPPMFVRSPSLQRKHTVRKVKVDRKRHTAKMISNSQLAKQ